MKEVQDVKKYFYVDESGDPTVLGRGGRDLLAEGTVSRTFTVGYVETQDPKTIMKSLSELRKELAEDEYLAGVPSMVSTLRAFHANKDCAEVKERVFKLLRQMDFTAFAVVARKSEALFRKKFDFSTQKLYEYLVSKLFENRLHLYKRIEYLLRGDGQHCPRAEHKVGPRRSHAIVQGEMGQGQRIGNPSLHSEPLTNTYAADRRLCSLDDQPRL